MGENLYNSAHKANSKEYRDHWEATFRRKNTVEEIKQDQKAAAIEYVKEVRPEWKDEAAS